MSDISVSQKAAKEGLKKIRQEAASKKYGEPPENTSLLWADLDLVRDLYDETASMCGPRYNEDGDAYPAFGLLSLILQTTPVFLYDHPALNKKCKTAFTDGVHVWVNQGFYKKLRKDVEESNYTTYGIELLLLHELSHKMFNHTERLRQFGPDIANRGADLSINTKLQLAFPDLKWAVSLRETALGFKPGDVDKFPSMSEEAICRLLLNESLKQKKDSGKDGKKSQKKDQPNQDGKGQNKSDKSSSQSKGQSGGQKGQPGDKGDPSEQGGGNGKPEDGPSDSFGDEGDNHLGNLQDLIETLEEAGLDDVKDLLELPDSDEVEEIGRFMDDDEGRQHEAILKAMAQSANAGGKYPGQHMVDAAGEYLKNFTKGKLEWRLAVRDLLLGDGNQYKKSFEELSVVSYVRDVEDELGNMLIVPVELPHKSDEVVLVMIDSSGSVDQNMLREFLSEVFELKTASANMGDRAKEVIVMFADTVVRGEPTIITDENVDEIVNGGITVQGRGGTDLAEPIRQTMKLDMIKEKKVRTLVYFSDLYAVAPKHSELGLPEGCKVAYIAASETPSPHIEEFQRSVESYADVIEITEGGVVDLSDEAPTKPVNKPTM